MVEHGDAQPLVVVVTGVETNETLERWTFAVNACDTENAAPSQSAGRQGHHFKQIQAIIRQITASVTFLPLLDGPRLRPAGYPQNSFGAGRVGRTRTRRHRRFARGLRRSRRRSTRRGGGGVQGPRREVSGPRSGLMFHTATM